MEIKIEKKNKKNKLLIRMNENKKKQKQLTKEFLLKVTKKICKVVDFQIKCAKILQKYIFNTKQDRKEKNVNFLVGRFVFIHKFWTKLRKRFSF